MMFIPLPAIEPRDSHALWYTPSQPTRHTSKPPAAPSSSHNASRRSAGAAAQRLGPPTADSLAALILEERALRIRKQNIASFGFSWIRPAGFPKTMMGIREEEMEREEGGGGNGGGLEFIEEDEHGFGEGEGQEGLEALERDLDGDIPDADDMGSERDEDEAEGRGLVERGEGEFQEDDDEEGLMERDLDGDIPDAFGDDYDEDEDGAEDRDLDADIPSASDEMDSGAYDDSDDEASLAHQEEEDEPRDLDDDGMHEDSMMARNLDSDVPSPLDEEQQEWEHTDTDEDLDDEDDDIEMSITMDVDPRRQSLPRHSLRSSMSGLPEPIPHIPQPRQETEAERLFIDRYSGGGSFASSDMMPEPSLRIPRRRTRRYSVPSDEDSIL